jgi:hypothetical protein
MIVERPLFDEAECAEIGRQVMALEPMWTRRNEWVPFYTVGSASYLDCRNAAARAAYLARAAEDNPLLRARFGWAYERLASALAESLGEPVEYAPAFALPGFHVFQPCMVFEQPFASVHLDLQYRLLDWEDASPDFTRPLSFTVAIALPATGGGLQSWDLHLDDIGPRKDDEITRYAKRVDPSFHPYRLGWLNRHSGHLVHRIAPMTFDEAGTPRITLQGHGVCCGGTWRLYW